MVRLFCALNKGVELNEAIWAAGGRQVLLGAVGGGEFGGDVGEVGEGQLARVRPVAYTDEAQIVVDQIAVGKSQETGRLGRRREGAGTYWYV